MLTSEKKAEIVMDTSKFNLTQNERKNLYKKLDELVSKNNKFLEEIEKNYFSQIDKLIKSDSGNDKKNINEKEKNYDEMYKDLFKKIKSIEDEYVTKVETKSNSFAKEISGELENYSNTANEKK